MVEGGAGASGSGTRSGQAAKGGSGGQYDTNAIRKQLEESAQMFTLPEPPTDKALCTLKFSVEEHMFAGTSLGDTKKLLAVQGSEAQSRSEAGLQFRFRDGTGLSLRFTWRHKFCGSPEYPPTENACVVSGRNVPDDYYLESGDRQGAPYPRCWPHKDPFDD